ncbi:MAG: response regulator transcription factor [Candidatus Acidiferrales bacterium]
MSIGAAFARQSGSGKPKTILIADDNERVRAVMRRSLEHGTDFKICEAIDGDDAVAKAKELAPDLVILDVRMPGLNGIEVAGILRYALPKIRIVFMTMYAEDLSEGVTSVFQVDAVLSKSSGLAQVVENVESLLVEPVS